MSTCTTDLPAQPASRAYRVAFIILLLLNFAKTATLIGAGQPFPESDGVNYWKMGIEFAQGDWLLRERAWAFRPPAEPVYLTVMQTAFGRYAIVAITVFQLLLDLATALIVAWICAAVTGRREGAIVGLALSFLCISRSCFMIFILADNLLCAALVLYFAAFVAWLKKPSCWTAMAMGILVALAALLKPIAQPLWLPTLLIMGYSLWRKSALGKLWRHAAVLLLVMGALLAPWYVRNKVLFGKYFLTQFTGRALWSGCHGRANQMPVEDSHGPKNQALLAALKGVDVNMEGEWSICHALEKLGYSDYELDKLMEAAMWESIFEHPGQYLSGRVLRFAWFWTSPKPWLDVPWGCFYAWHGLPSGWPTKIADDQPLPSLPPGQATWTVPFLKKLSTAILRVVWHPNMFVFGLGSLAAFIGCALMIRDPAHREVGLLIAAVMLLLSVGTSFFVWPQYRYRLPLEPFMIVAVTPMLLSIGGRVAARLRKAKPAA